MFGQLTNIPTDSLVELLFVIITDKSRTAKDLAQVDQIRYELRRRGEWQSLDLAHAG